MSNFDGFEDIGTAVAILVIMILVFSGFCMMWLWNWIVPIICPSGIIIGTITYWQAWGIMLLSRFIFPTTSTGFNKKS